VTINYRLGTLGFLALNDGVTNGNFGLADQITALQWVQQHIRAFGGDPERVTIFGQSAGAASVRALLASPRAAGKFVAAIPMSNLAGSNYATTYSEYYTIEQEVTMFAKPILNVTDCTAAPSHLACLRKANPYFLANQSDPDIARYLVVDGTYLTAPDLPVSGHGHINTVPTMMGFMRDDGAAFISYPLPNDTFASFLTSNGFNTSIGPLDLWPEPNGKNETLDLFNRTARLATDGEFRCLDEATAYSAAKHGTLNDIYFYEFNRSYQLSTYSPNFPVCQPGPAPGFPDGDPSKEYFKCHSGELYYVFGTLAFNGLPPRDDWDIPMSQFVVDTWASFARTYDPTPEPAFLEARGFANTTDEILRSGSVWEPVQAGEKMTLRLMQYPSVGEGLHVYDGERECVALGFPMDYYERHS
jgi:carboxylesterase type B